MQQVKGEGCSANKKCCVLSGARCIRASGGARAIAFDIMLRELWPRKIVCVLKAMAKYPPDFIPWHPASIWET